ncbi:hypothetical protein [Bradyrhizobium sp. HKCCYLR20261]|uniref:hypothetical protein n=1 Tax=Bradyrhizobium sp. HKCCYLR20261 TaxID=3420760 RepID=UPI003EB8D94D
MVKNKLDFYRKCGNRYVSSLAVGGEFSAVIDIETNSETERSDLRSTMSVVATGYGSASASYAAAMQKISNSYQKNIRIIRNGTGEAIPSLTIDSLVNYSLAFPTKINAVTGAPMSLSYADYQTIDPSIETYRDQEIVVSGMANQFGDFFELLGDLDYYSKHRTTGSFYPPLGDDELQRYRGELSVATINAKLAFNACVEDPGRKCTLASFPAVTINAPRPAQQTSLDPKSGAYQPVGTAGKGENKTVIVIGSWSAWDNGENLWWPPERCCFEIRIEGEEGPPVTKPYTGPVKFTGPARVSVHIGDSTYGDNRGRGLAAIVY